LLIGYHNRLRVGGNERCNTNALRVVAYGNIRAIKAPPVVAGPKTDTQDCGNSSSLGLMRVIPFAGEDVVTVVLRVDLDLAELSVPILVCRVVPQAVLMMQLV